MIRNADLFSVATSGLRASNRLLDTTANNIANVNTEGYVRERTSFGSELTGGVGRGTTERVINTFAQNQLRRDTTLVGEHETYEQRASVLDNIFAGEANSVSASLSRFFGSLQTASDEPTNLAARQLVLAEANSMVGQIGTISQFLDDKRTEINLEMESTVNRANSLIQTISDLNDQIRVLQGNNSIDEPGAVKNERDLAVLELAELMSIETRINGSGDGTVQVNLTTGESLVLQDGSFNLFALSGDPDASYQSLQLTSVGTPTTLNVQETNLGGVFGGLFRYRDEILEPAQRELGQIALSTAGALNEQNRLGMDFDLQLGTDIFALPEFQGLNYAANANLAHTANARLTSDGARNLTSADYQVTINAVTAGAPPTLDVTVALLNPDGTPVLDTAGNPRTQNFPAIDAVAGTFSSDSTVPAEFAGIEFEFPEGAAYSAGDQFLFQPTKGTADDLVVSMTRPEDLAFALPVRVDANINNFGDASLVSTTVTNTFVDNTFANPDASAFTGAGGVHAPGASPTGGGGVGAPASIVFDSATDFRVLDSAGTTISTVVGATDFENILTQAAGGAGYPAAFAALNDYPGFDFSLQGVPRAGDVFTISYNTDGLNDNRNAVDFGDLQSESIVLSSNDGTQNRVSFQEKYSNIVGSIGEKSAVADVALRSAEALKSQSKDWFDSISGVNLDEEAANLVKFQQAYSASARILTTAQALFDTILSAAR